MDSSPQAPSFYDSSFSPGLHIVSPNSLTDVVSDSADRCVSHSRFVRSTLLHEKLTAALSQTIDRADEFFDSAHQMRRPPHKEKVLFLIAQLGCLIAGPSKEFRGMDDSAQRFAQAVFLESDLPGRFSRFIESLHECSLPAGMEDAFVSYIRCWARDRQIHTLQLLEISMQLISKLAQLSIRKQRGGRPGTSFIVINDLELFTESAGHGDKFLACVQDLAVLVDVAVLCIRGGGAGIRKGKRVPWQDTR